MIIEKTTTRCTDCYSEFTESQLEGQNCCPNCKTTSLPMFIDRDTTIKINWHELRILTMWASFWANEKLKHEPGYKTLNNIINRLELQKQDNWPALTLFGEINNLRDAGYKVDLISNNNIHKDPKGEA